MTEAQGPIAAARQLIDPHFYDHYITRAHQWLAANAVTLSIATLGQIIAIGLAFLLARWLRPRLERELDRLAHGRFEAQLIRIVGALRPLLLSIIWLILLWLAELAADEAVLPLQLLNLVVSLLSAWVAIRLSASLVRNPAWSRLVTLVAWVIAALNILNLLAPTTELLDGMAFTLGTVRISVLTIIEGLLILAALMWLAALTSRVLERRIAAAGTLTPSLRVLVTKLLRIVLGIIAVAVALRAVGIDLTAFAVFTGAIGVGIGFGLQKAVSNFVSGITILLEKSIKPGDVITVGETYGRVHALSARYVTVITRDGMEYLIPNDELVYRQVINWSYSSEQVRVRLPIRVAYRSDLHQAVALCVQAAGAVDRVLGTPAPVCLVRGFGESAVDLELRFWIGDPMSGVSNVQSKVLLQVWDRFHQHGIEIPLAQRDLHVHEPVEIVLNRRPDDP